MSMRAFLFGLLLLPIAAFSTSNDTKRYQDLIQEIRCVVCQGQAIADSNALLASDMRNKVYAMVQENKTNDEIKDYLAHRYGESILLQPRFNKLTFLLWLFPFAAIFIGLSIVFIFVRAKKTSV